ncbi:MAG: hypothetical protein KAG66_18140, partial [Methylococcales bacterium]|nr:hypothetical protein [Methylococcales bacterium]
ARHAWWAYQSPEIARNLLKSSKVVHSELGPELAEFLLEFLPFEERALNIVESVQRCLQGKLIDEKARARLWERAKRKNPFFVGFMLAGPDTIPIDESAHPDYESVFEALQHKDAQDNPYADYLLHFLSPNGRKWLKSLHLALKKPTEPDVVIAMFISVDHYIKLALAPTRGVLNIDDAIARATQLCAATNTPKQLQFVCDRLSLAQIKQLEALLILAQLGENTLNSVFGGRDATGTVMRSCLQPLSTQVNNAIKTLLT